MERAPFIDTGKHPGKDGLEYKNGTEHRICVSSYWRKVRLMFDASSRFRHILHMAEDELSKDSSHLSNTGKCKLVDDSLELQLRKFSTVAHVLRATLRFKEAGQKCQNGPVPPGFGIGPHQLQNIMLERQLQTVVRHGGVSKIAKLLNSNLDSGLDDFDDALEERRTAFGSNKVPSKPGKSFWMFVWDACHDTTLIILMVCAVVSLAAEMWSDGPKEGWYDGVSIAAAVAIVIVITATSDYRQSLQFKSLSEEKKNVQVEVIRRGRRCKISIFDILVGDIVPINIGDQVPADGILVSGQSLTIDESCMTGESLPVHKDMKEPFLLSGCKVVDGYGSMLVLAVGLNTEWGKILSTLSEDNGEETPLQVRLSGAAKLIGQVGLTVAVVVFVILFVRFFAVDFKKNSSASNAINKLVNAFAIAVTIVVVAVPEGLPLAVTLTLAYSMRKMMTDKSMVRKLAACETMGSATTICSDKTGTLTLNQMVVTKSWVAGKLREAEEVQIISKPVYKTILAGLCQNSTGSVYVPTDGGESEVAGTPTETAALAWGLQIGMNYDEIKRSTSAVHIEAFNSAKKRAGVIIRRIDGNVEAHWKGAAEMILEMSANWVDENGVVHSMTPEMATELKNNIEGMAAKSLRCIAFAYKPLSRADVPDTEEKRKTWKIPDDDLTFLCVIGIKDPCRPGVSDAVTKCKAAQIKVRMVTGDSLLTAQAIAQECGILTKDGVVVEGRVFREYSQEDMDRVLPRLDVLARSSPTDKLLLVKELKKRGDVVAVTGDGTNDAPALHDADVGLSMGISGTEVAKESSDIVILDDNFASIVKVVRWGRSVYANIQKFIQFQLTVNVTALVINFVAAVSSGKVPLTAVQLLWVNLIMDTLGALALATEPPTDDLMDKAPVGRTQPLITNVMWRSIFTQSLYQIAVLMTIDYAGKSIFALQGEADSEIRKNTIVFNSFVMCQVFNEVNARRPDRKNVFEGLFKNRLFVAIILLEVVFQFLIVQFLGKFATTKPLTWQQWLVCVAIGSVAWPLALCSKFFPVREKPYVNTHGLKMTLRRNWRRKGPALLRSNVSSSSSSHANVAGDVVHGNELPQLP